jgi:hypothetical protein
MKIQDLQNKINEYYEALDYPESEKKFNLIKRDIEEKWNNELKNLSINEDFTFISFSEGINSIEVDEIENYKKDSEFSNFTTYFEKNIKYYITTNYFVGEREFKIDSNIISNIRTLNEGDKININLKFLEFNCLYNKQRTTLYKDKKFENISFGHKIFSFDIIFIIDSLKIINKIEYQKINLFQLKEKISNYCNQFNLPKNESEDIEFKKVFDHNWKKEIQFLLFEERLTYQKKEFGIHFIETELKNSLSSKILILFNFKYHPEIEKLNDGDKVNIRCEITKIESTRINGYQGMIQPQFNIEFAINSFEIVEKYNKEFEIKKLEEKFLKKEETENESKDNKIKETISTNNNINQTDKIKSFNEVLDFIIELRDLRYNSRNLNSTLNSFQNKVFNEKNLNEFNSKKEILKNYIGLEFKTICEIREIREQTIDFNLYLRNKLFSLGDSRYNKILQKKVFFLKNNSSVEISFKIKEIKDDLTRFNIQLLSIEKNNKVKLFGKFIKLEHFWLGIYISLILYTLVLFSKINFYGVIPLIFKITLGVIFGYILNKLLIKKIDNN